MVLEVALIDVTDADGFTAAFLGAREVVTGTLGCRSVRMTHGIEDPLRFVLLVEWDSVEAHEENFRGTERFEQWRAAIGPFFAHPPLVQHFARRLTYSTPHPTLFGGLSTSAVARFM